MGLGVIDTHAHLDMSAFNDDRDQVVERARAAGLAAIVTVGTDADSSSAAVALAARHDLVYAGVGLHPHDADKADEDLWRRLETLAAEPRVVAWGETGLDYYRDYAPRAGQREAFVRQIELAARTRLPLVVHSREATDETMELLARHGRDLTGVVMHCFSGDEELWRFSMDCGYLISVAGVLTFKNAEALRRVVRRTPLKRLMVETDCPYLAPAPRRGKRNEPALVVHVARALAELKGVAPEEAAEVTTATARRFFNLFNLPNGGEALCGDR